jgi:hypothetical protein
MTDARLDSTGRPAGEHTSVALLQAALGLGAFTIATQAALGAVGALAVAPVVVALGAAAAAVAFTRAGPCPPARIGARITSAPPGPTPSAGGPWTATDGAACLALGTALATRAWEGVHRARFTYDALSYHLHLPASWRAAGRLAIVATPFGDQAPAYAPSNAELVYELLLAVTGNVRLAHAGQLPFAGLASLALIATARTLGASRAVAAGAAVVFLLIPEVWQQATSAMADLAVAAFFLSAVPFLLRSARAPSMPDAVGLALALGLLLGTKYVGALLALPIVATTLAIGVGHTWANRGRRSGNGSVLLRVIGLVFVVVASGGFWYLRNAFVTGNPTFPVTLRLGGLTLARGLFDGVAMRAWTYHLPVQQLQPLLEIIRETGLGFMVSGTIAVFWSVWRRRLEWPAALAVMIALAWVVVPYQQSRFFFSAWGIASVLLALATTALPSGRRAVAVGIPIVAAAVEFPTAARVLVAAVWLVAVVADLRGTDRTCRWLTRAAGWPKASRSNRVATMALAAALLAAPMAWARARPGDQAYTIGDTHDAGWAFARDHLHGRRIAYAGSNLAVPLWGWRLDNQVRYVPIAGGPDALVHDRGADAVAGPTGMELAAPSSISAEPAPERASPDRAAWIANLAHHRSDILFVTALYPEVQASMDHDSAGFPVERRWAESAPRMFSLLFASDGVQVYEIRRDGRPADGGGAP